MGHNKTPTIKYRKVILFTNYSFLDCLALIKPFGKNDRFLYLKQSQNILSFLSFSSAIISFKIPGCNFNLDFFCLAGSIA